MGKAESREGALVRLDRGRPRLHLRGAAGVAATAGMEGTALAMADGIERKLTTILAADVEGYSRLMAEDEIAAMTALREARSVFARLIARHRGRIANTAGDGLLADFPSVVEAVHCAIEVQTELAAQNVEREAGAAMRFRIGLHLGDVMVEDGDLLGEGVNLAARLQAMAEPGGILISQAVYDQVRSKVPVSIEPAGTRRPRNLPEPVPVYRLVIGASAPPASRIEQGPTTETPTGGDGLVVLAKRLAILGAALVAINLATGGAFWAIWPLIVIGATLGLRAAPLLAHDPANVQLVRLGAVVMTLALINLASRSSYPWFLWPTGALLMAHLLWRTTARRDS
jgi:adenylate cyclase